MAREAPSLRYDAEQRTAANEGGFGLLAEIRQMRKDIEKLEAHRQSHLDLRQRAISTWVRDALNKGTVRRKEEIRRLNKDIIHGGDVRSDAMVVTERYRRSSTEWQSFRTLYGLTPDDMKDLGIVYRPLLVRFLSLICSRPAKVLQISTGLRRSSLDSARNRQDKPPRRGDEEEARGPCCSTSREEI